MRERTAELAATVAAGAGWLIPAGVVALVALLVEGIVRDRRRR